MKELIKVIAFDADDTLWSNEPFFQDIEKQYTDLLKSYGTPEDISAALFQTEMNNLKCLGYGAKAFTISMVETALRVSGRKISATDIQHIIELGKSLLKMPIELLPGVKETLKTLKKTGKYKLVVATKGDLLDQENKLERSGLAPYFDHIEVMSDKTEKEYQRMLNILQITPSELVMVGNCPGLDMISFGPTLRSPHSPDERAYIPSVTKFYDFLVATLEQTPEK